MDLNFYVGFILRKNRQPKQANKTALSTSDFCLLRRNHICKSNTKMEWNKSRNKLRQLRCITFDSSSETEPKQQRERENDHKDKRADLPLLPHHLLTLHYNFMRKYGL